MPDRIVNPYAKRKPPHPLNASDPLPNGSLDGEDAVLTNEDAMGRQSQTRTPPTKQLRQLATRRQHQDPPEVPIVPNIAHFDINQRAVDNIEERAFHPLRDCEICIAKEYNLRIPHRRHHDSCPSNRITHRASATEVQSDKESQRLRRLFSKQMDDPEKERELTGGGTLGVLEYMQAVKKRKESTPSGAATKTPPNVEKDFLNGDKVLSPDSTPQEGGCIVP